MFKTVTRRDEADGSVTVRVQVVGPAGWTATTVHDCTSVDDSGNAARNDHERSMKTTMDVVFAPAADGTSVVEFSYVVPATLKTTVSERSSVLLTNVACTTTREPVVREAPFAPTLGACGAVTFAAVLVRRRSLDRRIRPS